MSILSIASAKIPGFFANSDYYISIFLNSIFKQQTGYINLGRAFVWVNMFTEVVLAHHFCAKAELESLRYQVVLARLQ